MVMLSNPGTENPVNLEAAQMLTKDLCTEKYCKDFSRDRHRRKTAAPCYLNTRTSCSVRRTARPATHVLDQPKRSHLTVTAGPGVESLGILLKARFAIARSRHAPESQVPSSVSFSGEMTHLCSTPEELPTESQPEIGHVRETHETEEERKDEDSTYDYYTYDPWDKEVDNLIAWTNALDTDALDDQY
ncbi:ubiquitin-conjugating enzyme E2 U isoform X2 [Heterocephalus glaber]|uniref:Ubiquitin-conjugating enzyme E2 U isoform X2 n=1 Tax=Heterocephalus glaber TaxID=10181 RepID=A0AAX6SRI4_HETGA|nr:ubiquitin-conjugating enzyme E2 U isoform X2 [Heterocephalus glaber]